MKNTLLLGLGLILAIGPAQAASIAPHRAIYDLTLLRSTEGAALQSAAGRLAFEIQGSTCEGWTVSFRMATKYRPSEGDPTLIDTQTTTYEGPGGLDFRHQLKEYINSELKDDMRIKLTRETAEGEAKLDISDKPGEAFTIPAGVLLPMQHQLRLMALGDQGGGRDSSLIFDGSDDDHYFRAISFVGKAKPAGAIARDKTNTAAAPLANVGSWPMTISYFKPDGGEETPDYQVSFDMYQNGVATGLVLDYGDFALSGTLEQLQMLEPSECP